jgi:hypothetical protein
MYATLVPISPPGRIKGGKTPQESSFFRFEQLSFRSNSITEHKNKEQQFPDKKMNLIELAIAGLYP